MKILVVTYSYLPHISPRSLRWSALVEQWVKIGHSVEVIVNQVPGSPPEEVLAGAMIHRVPSWDARWRHTPSESAPSTETQRSFFHSLKSPLRHFLKKIYQVTWKPLMWPDYAAFWYPPAYKKARQLMEQKSFDALVTISHPFGSHLIGWRLKKKFPSIPWLMDIGDPFSFLDYISMNNTWLYSGLNRWVEHKALLLADKISVTTEPTKDAYLSWLPSLRDKIKVIPPLLRDSVWKNAQLPVTSKLSTKELNLVFVGTLYREIRSPLPVLEFFSQLQPRMEGSRLRLHFYGSYETCADLLEPFQRKYPDQVFVHGNVPPEEASQALCQADVLINIGNKTPYQLPSKVVEYAATGKAILNFINAKSDSSQMFFQPYPRVVHIGSPKDLSLSLQEALQLINSPPLFEENQLKLWLEKYTASHLAPAYLEMLI